MKKYLLLMLVLVSSFSLKIVSGYSQTYKFHKKKNNTMLYNIGFMEDIELEDWDMYFRH